MQSMNSNLLFPSRADSAPYAPMPYKSVASSEEAESAVLKMIETKEIFASIDQGLSRSLLCIMIMMIIYYYDYDYVDEYYYGGGDDYCYLFFWDYCKD